MVEAGLQARAAGDNVGALAQFQAANQARPDDPWILFRMAEELRHLRRHEEAESALDAALVLSGGPKHRIMLEMGHLAHAMGDRERALLRFQEAGAAAPADPWPSLYAGQMLWRLGRPQEAQPALERAAAPDTPARLPALMHLGHLARELGQHAAALGHFQAAAEIAPDDPWPHLYAGQELRRAGRADEARAALGRVPAGSPARSHAVMELGHVAAGAGTMEEALAHFREAAALLPLDPWPRLHEAAALRAIGRLDHAAATYRAVLEGWPGNYAALVGLGQVARAQGDLTAAEAHLRAATEIDPDAPAAWTELAATLAEGGAEDVALMVLGRVAGGAPQQAEPALLAQVQLHRQAGRFEAALGLLRRLEGPPPGRPDILAEMAQEERRLGRPDAARALLDRALATEPSQLQALMQLAELARTARDLPGAAEAYRRAVAAHPNNPWPRIGLAQVLHDGGALTEALEALDAAAKVAGS
ncbi:MAG TPA: tetratricopeptide repeat protein, partial [Acetobacteraceae bacterium]|nr:tetratricopeptide repeat protein [Acetobacteraceae bacterium]